MSDSAESGQGRLRSYEQIGYRIQRLVNEPNAQKTRALTVSRLPDEDPVQWRHIIDDMAGTVGVRVIEVEDGTVRIGWGEYIDS
ncbi:DUF1654 domain-containing protein [Pseudomonas cremoricolorata]|uniref:DUF1654 domain-containing protein n=1 Tax=Pseudomonas cremoricolorata TaxID=157783 RepID=A0A089WMN2_9PSED|nr:DUF1654 domain-containing protein [Pseudomonas cremoricolorata]AIR90560.1 hypothetical protein LK03_15285 [Pseudomonas cremoricolorata]